MKKAQSFVGLQLLPDSEVIPVGPTIIESRITRERFEFTKCLTTRSALEDQLAAIFGQSLKGNKSRVLSS